MTGWRIATVAGAATASLVGASRDAHQALVLDFVAGVGLALVWIVMRRSRAGGAQRGVVLLFAAVIGGEFAGAFAGPLVTLCVLVGLGGWWLWRRWAERGEAADERARMTEETMWRRDVERSKAVEEHARRVEEAIRRENHELEVAQLRGGLLDKSPTEFEHMMVLILGRLGFALQHVGGPGDLGADLYGIDQFGRSVMVQCKRYAPGIKVGSSAVQSFIGMRTTHHKADRGLIITTSSFTAPARQLAEAYDVQLVDGDLLMEIVRRAANPTARHALGVYRDQSLPLL